ncbi:sulfate respiration complex protein HmcD [Pseudodesulfovibrio sp.]|nr:DNA-binding protein [Pseudodesulfovibrio sp.]MDD3313110.1 DNA-binding protein [Pseudodesulfovibrio sp.]
MEFFTLQDYYTHTKGIVYLIMGGILVAATLYWQFLMGGNRKDD